MNIYIYLPQPSGLRAAAHKYRVRLIFLAYGAFPSEMIGGSGVDFHSECLRYEDKIL